MSFNEVKTWGKHRGLPLRDITFVFLDVETTGLHPQYGDRICEMGLLRTKDGKTLDAYETLINPYVPISPGAFNVHGISVEMLKDAPPFSQIIDDFLEFIKGAAIVGHNVLFDLEFIGSQLNQLQIPFPDNPVIDTLTLARTYYDFSGNGLTKIAAQFNIDIHNQHRALGDARMTKEIFHIFINDFKKMKIRTFYDLLELQGGSLTFPTYGEIILPPEIEESIKNNRQLDLRYVSAYGEETIRTIEPLEVIPYKDYTYLIANCLLRGGERRTFRLDRILEMHIAEEKVDTNQSVNMNKNL